MHTTIVYINNLDAMHFFRVNLKPNYILKVVNFSLNNIIRATGSTTTIMQEVKILINQSRLR